MTEEWFKWERESTIHSLFVPLEAAMQPLRNYFGRSWPDTILIFKGNIVLWCNKIQPLYDLGQEMIDFYLNEKNLKKLNLDLNLETGNLKKMFSKIDKTDLKKLSANELLLLYSDFRKQYIEWYKIGWTVEPVALQGEQLILKKTSDKKMISVLTSTTSDSFSKRELKDLLQIALMNKGGKETDKLLELHAKKYFWIHNGYFKTIVLGKDFFRKEMNDLLRENPDPKKYLSELNEFPKKTLKLKKEAMHQLDFNAKERKLVDLIDFFGWFQDYRKEFVMQSCHYLDLLLREIGRRSSLSLRDMSYTFPEDLKLILEKKFDKKELKKRMKNCIVVWNEFKDCPEFFIGKKALEKEKGLFPLKENSNQVIELTGMIASMGKAEGKARVTMSPEEAKKLEKGEILVTSMTSPDFITAIKKAKAIVTNEGGITCHAAIVSRELGIPCIVGTKIATKILKTGDFVEVNANHGFVRKIVRKNS